MLRALLPLVVAGAAASCWSRSRPTTESTPSAPVDAATDGRAVLRSVDAAHPAPALATLDELLADDLVLLDARYVNPTVVRLELRRGAHVFRAKWKPLAPGGTELQEGFDGNNAPRCEVAAYRLDRLLFPDEPAPYLVPPVVVRAVHRDVPCDRACAHLPRLASAATPPTFAALNDHLVLGALTVWIDGARQPTRFRGDLWDPARFAADAHYRRSFSDLTAFLFLIAHGDANYASNFLLREPHLDHVYSIDNGRALDGVPFYSGDADPDWQPLARLTPKSLVATRFSRRTAARLGSLSPEVLRESLRVVAAVELTSGRAVFDPAHEPALLPLHGRPLSSVPGLVRRSRQTYTGRPGPSPEATSPPWLLLGIGERGLTELLARAAALGAQLKTAPLLDD